LSKIAVIGLGHIGLTLSLHYARQGHSVCGLEADKEKIKQLENENLYFFEPQLKNLLNNYKKNFSCHDYKDFDFDLVDTVIICVGTPYKDDQIDTSSIQEIALKLTNFERLKIILRSTVPPGTTRKLFESHEKTFFVPEFLREGSAISDIQQQGLIVGVACKDTPIELPSILTQDQKKVQITDFETAELLKYSCNAFHSLKVAFTNEVSSIAKECNVDANELFNLFKEDKQLNISESYLNPGPAFGGPCLPKDLKGLKKIATQETQTPLLESILKSNDEQITRMSRIISKNCVGNIAFSGISFKPNTNDLRGSVLIDIIKHLRKLDNNCQITFHDPYNRNYQENEVSYLTEELLLASAQTLILGTISLDEDAIKPLLDRGVKVIDLGYFKVSHQIESHKNYVKLF